MEDKNWESWQTRRCGVGITDLLWIEIFASSCSWFLFCNHEWWHTAVHADRPVFEVANFAVFCQHCRASVSRWLGLFNESRSCTQSV